MFPLPVPQRLSIVKSPTPTESTAVDASDARAASAHCSVVTPCAHPTGNRPDSEKLEAARFPKIMIGRLIMPNNSDLHSPRIGPDSRFFFRNQESPIPDEFGFGQLKSGIPAGNPRFPIRPESGIGVPGGGGSGIWGSELAASPLIAPYFVPAPLVCALAGVTRSGRRGEGRGALPLTRSIWNGARTLVPGRPAGATAAGPGRRAPLSGSGGRPLASPVLGSASPAPARGGNATQAASASGTPSG
jgi:hypothetical protein